MRMVFMGTPDFAAVTLRALLQAGHEVCGVVTQPDKPKGRKQTLTPPPAKEEALSGGIPVLQPARVRDGECEAWIRALAPEVIVVAAFGQIIPKGILTAAPLGCVNVHASLLPAYRGAAPIQWAVLNGEPESGVTIMQMNEGLDTGDILAQTRVALRPEETSGTLFDRLADAGAALLLETLPRLAAGELSPCPQPEMSPTAYARMIRKEDGRIDWTRTTAEIERQVRGMNPWPSAWTTLDGKTCKIWKASVVALIGGSLFGSLPGQDPKKGAGRVWAADETGIHVKTGDGVLVIEELQLEGRKRMRAADFLRGYTLRPGICLGKE